MSKNFIKKNIKLSLEFDRYLSKHPEAFAKIPNKSCIVITSKSDQEFSRESRTIAEKAVKKTRHCIEARKEGAKWILAPMGA